MTWSGWFTVQDVGDGPAPIDVLAVANADDKVKPYTGPQYAGSDFADQEVPALSSNTEGKLRSVEVRLVFDVDEPPLAVGDVININGHFTRRAVVSG
jgi:hypothetical protein